MDYQALLARITGTTREVFGENLTGVYLHGSAAMGCFNPVKSDLDLLIVIQRPMTDGERLNFLQALLPLNQEAPAKGIELSVVLRSVCKPFVYPTPFEFHFSNAHVALAQRDPEAYIGRLRGTDKDLAAHFTIINHYGVVLYGEEIGEVFGPVPREHYLDSILCDLADAEEGTDYYILNLCRVRAYEKEGLILSKKTGGEWGLKNLPQYADSIAAALKAYGDEQ